MQLTAKSSSNFTRNASAIVVDAHGHAPSMRRVRIGPPQDDEIVVRIVASGICHTDLLAAEGAIPVPLPSILGHEGSGVVEEVGPAVRSVKVGDHVVLGWAWCGECANCVAGDQRYCTYVNGLNFGGARIDGTAAVESDDGPLHDHFFGQSSWCTYSVVSERSVVVVDERLPLENLGPLTCGISTGAGAILNVLKPRPGSDVAVFGLGTVGLAAIMAARAAGATRVFAVARNARRLAQAAQFGATDLIDSSKDDPVATLRKSTDGALRYAVEATGSPQVVRQAVDSLGMLGSCAMLGVSKIGETFTLDHSDFVEGKRLVGVNGGESQTKTLVTQLLRLHAAGAFPFDKLITTYPFEQVATAIADMREGRTLKPVLLMPAQLETSS